MNKVILIGRIVRDLELKTTPNGHSVLSFSIAINRRNTVEGQPDVDFINCVAWTKTAENVAKYCGKGSQIAVEGRIQTRSYDNSAGQKIYVTEVLCETVQFLGTRPKEGGVQQTSFNQAAQEPQQVYQAKPGPSNSFYNKPEKLEQEFDNSNNSYSIMDDDLPF